MEIEQASQKYALQNLRREWLLYILAGGLFLAGFFFALLQAWGLPHALAWLAAAAATAGYLFAFLWKHLGDNRSKETNSARLFATLGLANGITLTRAMLISALAGFMLLPRGTGWLAWAPGLLYLASAVMDFLDGYAARVTRRTTLLGETLDMQWDSIGALAGIVILVLYRQAPALYLLVGVARYWFVVGLWLHRRRGLPVHDLPPNRFRRPLAGVQMGFIAAALLPVVGPPATWVAAVLFMLPHQVGFVFDFLSVTRRGEQAGGQGSASIQVRKRLHTAAIFLIRAFLIGLLVDLALQQAGRGHPSIVLLVIAALAVPALLFGAAGRVVSLGLLLFAGLNLQATTLLEWRYWFILIFSTVLFLTGTGPYSLWKPEDWLIDHRAGEA